MKLLTTQGKSGASVNKQGKSAAVPLDATYAATLKSLQDNMAGYLGTYNINEQRAKAYRTLQTGEIKEDRTNSLRSLLNGYAGSGLANSSSYGWNYANTQNQYGKQLTQVVTDTSQNLSDLDRQLADFKKQNTDAISSAKADAVARRAARYGS